MSYVKGQRAALEKYAATSIADYMRMPPAATLDQRAMAGMRQTMAGGPVQTPTQRSAVAQKLLALRARRSPTPAPGPTAVSVGATAPTGGMGWRGGLGMAAAGAGAMYLMNRDSQTPQ